MNNERLEAEFPGEHVIFDPEQEAHIEQQPVCFPPPDQEFPAQTSPDDKGFARSEGISSDIVSRETWIKFGAKAGKAAYSAADVHFDEVEMRREIVAVLKHHKILQDETRFTDEFCQDFARVFKYESGEPVGLEPEIGFDLVSVPVPLDCPDTVFRQDFLASVLLGYSAFRLRPHSRVWYAMCIFALFYCSSFVTGARHRFQAGFRWAEYIGKFRVEPLFQKGKASELRGKKAAEATNSKKRAKHTGLDEELMRLHTAGHSKKRAGELAHANGFGTSADANRKLLAKLLKK